MWKAADPEGRLLHEVPNYTLNLSKAWRIVEHLGRTHEVRLDRIPHPDSGTARWICEFTPLDKSHPGYYEVADTAELAICLSALQAKGVEAPAE